MKHREADGVDGVGGVHIGRTKHTKVERLPYLVLYQFLDESFGAEGRLVGSLATICSALRFCTHELALHILLLFQPGADAFR